MYRSFSLCFCLSFGLSLLQIEALGELGDESLMFEAGSATLIAPRAESCLQIGLSLTYRGAGPRSWNVLNSTLSYNISPELLAGPPQVRFSDLKPTQEHFIEITPCESTGPDRTAGFRVDEPETLQDSRSALMIEEVNPETLRIQLDGVSRTELLSTDPGQRYQFATITFPIKARTTGSVGLQFVPDSLVKDGNLLADADYSSLTAYTLGGVITIDVHRSLYTWGFGAFALAFLLSFGYRVRRRSRDP